VRDRALKLYQEVGPAETARRTGLRSGTIRAWASRAGGDLAKLALAVERESTAHPVLDTPAPEVAANAV